MWAYHDVDKMSLDDLEREAREIRTQPIGRRTVNDTDRLAALGRAIRRIRGRGSL